MSGNEKLVKREVRSVVVANRKEEVDLDLRQKKAEAAMKVVDLIVHGGRVFLDAHATNVEMTKSRRATEDSIALLDAQTNAELKKLEQSLLTEQDKTRRLQIVADAASRTQGMDPILAEALAHALKSTFPLS